jgi:cellobiose phosphorylase
LPPAAQAIPIPPAGARVTLLRLHNRTSRPRKLTVTGYAVWVLGTEREDTQMHVVTDWDEAGAMLAARNAYRPDFGASVAFLAASLPVVGYTGNRAEFLGRNGSGDVPAALLPGAPPLSKLTGAGLDPCGAIEVSVTLPPNGDAEVVFLLGEADSRDAARSLVAALREPEAARAALDGVRESWRRRLEIVQVHTPDAGTDRLLNGWLLYQDLACRVWGRTAFYQSGGAYGFRDQLQDVMALLTAAPEVAREQILRSAAHQFLEGDVQHWWHPPGGAGVRTRITDDLLWLPFVTAQYVRVTGDTKILDEQVPFLRGKALEPNEHDAYFAPEVTEERASLLEHCRRAVTRGHTASELHGLPLIGTGDWNDGLDRVGVGGKGESVWLAWFLCHVLTDWAELLDVTGNAAEAKQATANAHALAATIEKTAWDGAWYRRAYYDDGAPLGSIESDEAKIDSLPQSWSVLSGLGDPDRSRIALASVDQRLVKRDDGAASGMVLLFTPAFDHTPRDPGYIKGYVPGVRENGGQYTHGSLWVPLALAQLGDGDGAVDLLRRMSPVEHTRTADALARYKVEPYVVVADIYALEGRTGRGGWTWYTGSAAWMYRVWLEGVLGFHLQGGNRLTLTPALPRDWPGFTLTYRFGGSTYEIAVEKPAGVVANAVASVTMDGGEALPDGLLPLVDDGQAHAVRVVLAAAAPLAPLPGLPAAPSNGNGVASNGAAVSTTTAAHDLPPAPPAGGRPTSEGEAA